jgi:hypothetical protein
MQETLWIGLHVFRKKYRWGCLAKHNLSPCSVDEQAFTDRLHQDPLKRDLRKAGIIFAIAAADIGVDAGEPDLAKILRRLTGRGWQGRSPEVVLVAATMLMDRNGVTPGAKNRVLPVEGEFDRRIDPSIRTDRVPEAAEIDFNLARKCILEGFFRRECLR